MLPRKKVVVFNVTLDRTLFQSAPTPAVQRDLKFLACSTKLLEMGIILRQEVRRVLQS